MPGYRRIAWAAAVMLAVLLSVYPFCASANWLDDLETQSQPPALVLSPADLTMNKGESRKITASVSGLPKGVRAVRYDWSSPDPEIAEYLNGTVRAAGGGITAVHCTAILSDGQELATNCPVTVTVPVSSIRAASPRLEVMAGDAFLPEVQILPEDATDPALTWSSSDKAVVRIGWDGQPEAVAPGQATLTAVSVSSPSRQTRIAVTVTRKLGRTEGELRFQDIPWESDHETCIRLLKESGFIAEDARNHCIYSDSVWHWPENDLLFSRASAWKMLPVEFTDQKTGAGRTSLDPQKTIGGFMPQTATLIYLNGIGEDGEIDTDRTRLIGAYFCYDNRHEKGTTVFLQLLARLEEQYGEFTRYMSEGIPRYYDSVYQALKESLDGAKAFGIQDLGENLYLGEAVLCTLRGADNTGIMLSIDMSETVTLFYGRTDAPALISELKEALSVTVTETAEDAGV